jgi:hypothetical protein
MTEEDVEEYVEEVVVIEPYDAKEYVKTLRWVRTRLIRAFDNTNDRSLRRVINHHGPVLESLIDELTMRG